MKLARRIAGLGLILAGLFLFIWTALPTPETTKTLTLGGPQQVSDQALGVWWEYREVTITYPASLRLGQVARLNLEAVPGGNVAAAQSPFIQYAVFAEAYPEMAQLSTAPDGTLSLAWEDGETLKFTWQMRADREGRFEGRLWFSLRLVPRDKGEEIHYPLLAVPLDVEVISLLGLDITTLRWVAVVLVLVGLGLLFWTRKTT